jgi:hypothetical protein
LHTRTAVVAYEGRAVASHHSALVVRRLPTYAADLRQVHLTRTADRWSRRRPGLTQHEMVTGARAEDGIIDVALAIAQTGCVNGSMSALVAADAALHRGLLDVDDLAEACDLLLGSQASVVRTVLRRAEGTAESPGETRLRHALQTMGFAVAAQFPIVDGSFEAIVDFMVEGCVAVEFDGFVKYGRRRAYAVSAAPAELVVAEKIREDHIRELGHEMVRPIWSDLDELPALRRRIERALHLAQGRGARWVRAER